MMMGVAASDEEQDEDGGGGEDEGSGGGPMWLPYWGFAWRAGRALVREGRFFVHRLVSSKQPPSP